jgi:hypothetical protein
MFQGTTPTGENLDFAGGMNDKDPRNLDFVKSQKSLAEFSGQILEAFTQGRERIYELQRSITDTLPNVRRLGGDIKDVASIISEVALESRRNVVANSEEIESLFVASKVLGVSAKEISKSFLDVGMSIESIPDALNESMDYVQSIGGNAKTVMKDVSDNMAQMNRYQFEGGVQGLTKMAAKASMLRFEMKETFALAEKVLDPEGAIEVAGAFQRLGVAAGNLVDPFQLMNMSINDPSGLQDSLADVAKQFTEFDAETKTFTINPKGVLTLREMEKAANLSQGSLSKLGLAAAELDQRLSAVNAAGLTIASEEDKQYLANIAKMDSKTKTYKVTLEDGTKRELSQLNQTEFEELIQAQKDGPKTLEDTARQQLSLNEIMQYDLAAIKAVIVGATLTSKPMTDINEVLRTAYNTATKSFEEEFPKTFQTAEMRKEFEGIFEELNFKDEIKNIVSSGKFKPEEILTELMSNKEGKLYETANGAYDKLLNISKDISASLLPLLNEDKTQSTTTTASPTTTSYGNVSVLGQTGVNPNFKQGAVPTAPQKPIEVDGDIDVNVKFQNLPTSLTPEQIAEVIRQFNIAINEGSFKNYIINLNKPENKYGSQPSNVY